MVWIRGSTQVASYSRYVCTFLAELTREALGVVLSIRPPRCDMPFFIKEDDDPDLLTGL
jgi:hypothetical protein